MQKIQKFESTLLASKVLTPTVKQLRLSMPKGFTFTPGQFVSMVVELNGKTIRRPYSIASPTSDQNHIDLCIKHVDGGAGRKAAPPGFRFTKTLEP